MSSAGNQHPVETAVEWLAPMPLAAAVGWAGVRLEFSSVAATAIGIGTLALGLAAIKLGGRVQAVTLQPFDPVEFASSELGELLLDEMDSVLDLDDRLEGPGPDSRVVQLFAKEEPTPGELVDRIAHFLGGSSRAASGAGPASHGQRLPDASAALHDALANIRASLR